MGTAKYHQMKEEWSKAYDSFKLAMNFMKQLKESTTDINITCAITLATLNRYSESHEHAERGCKLIEKELGIDPKRPISEFKY